MRSITFATMAALVTAFFMSMAVAGAAVAKGKNQRFVGHVYMQTNSIKNEIVHYGRLADGSLVVVEQVSTGGAGSGIFKPVSGQESAPNAFEGAGSVILSPDRKFLFTTNGGDNSVSSFGVGEDGRLTLLHRLSTGEAVTGKSGTAKSLAYASASRTLFVLHAFGPNHIRAFSVDNGKLTLRPEVHTVNTVTKTDRIPTHLVLSPDQRFLLVDILFDFRPAANADGTPKLVVANAPDPDGLVVFPVGGDGSLGKPSFQDAGGGGPFYVAFLNGSKDQFLNGVAVGDGVLMSSIDAQGKVSNSPLVEIDTTLGKPSELCWLAITSDNKLVFATNFGYSYVSSFRIIDGKLSLAKDPASAVVPGDGKFLAVNNLVSSGPSDSWISPDDKFFYQIYGNASALVAYRINKRSASLKEIARVTIPYNSPQGLAGY